MRFTNISTKLNVGTPFAPNDVDVFHGSPQKRFERPRGGTVGHQRAVGNGGVGAWYLRDPCPTGNRMDQVECPITRRGNAREGEIQVKGKRQTARWYVR